MKLNEKELIVLVGPTASGKTEVALQLIKKFPLEIISADSRQIYKFMDIGTGKLKGLDVHHLIDIVKPDEDFTVADYKKRAEEIIKKIYKRKKIPFLVGGSGFYIRAVVDGLCPAPRGNFKIRKALELEGKKQGIDYLYNRLKEVDPLTAEKVNPNDLYRIIRTLEVYIQTGKPISYYHRLTKVPDYNLLIFGIRHPVDELYKRINKRIDTMIERGLIKEVEGLLNMGYEENLKSMNSLGYKEIIGYLKGKYGLEEAIRLLKRNTRRYAKRQMTWFRNDKRISWIDVKDGDVSFVTKEIEKILMRRWYVFSNN